MIGKIFTYQISYLSHFPGATFGLLCLKIATSLVLLFTLDIDLTKQLATENATLVWLSVLPTYSLALLLLFLFYEYCHVWKSEGVVVGFKYDCNENSEESLYDKNFKGSWVSHSEDDSPNEDSSTIRLQDIIVLNGSSHQIETQGASTPLLKEHPIPDSLSPTNDIFTEDITDHSNNTAFEAQQHCTVGRESPVHPQNMAGNETSSTVQ